MSPTARIDADEDEVPRLVPAGAHSSPHKKNGVASSHAASSPASSHNSPNMISTFTPGAWKSLLAFFILSFAYIAGTLRVGTD